MSVDISKLPVYDKPRRDIRERIIKRLRKKASSIETIKETLIEREKWGDYSDSELESMCHELEEERVVHKFLGRDGSDWYELTRAGYTEFNKILRERRTNRPPHPKFRYAPEAKLGEIGCSKCVHFKPFERGGGECVCPRKVKKHARQIKERWIDVLQMKISRGFEDDMGCKCWRDAHGRKVVWGPGGPRFMRWKD